MTSLRFIFFSVVFTFSFFLFPQVGSPQDLSLNPGALKFPPLKKDKTNSSLWLFQKPSKQIEIHLLEDFESKLPWINPHKAANRHIHRFVYLNPLKERKIQTPLKTMYKKDFERLRESARMHFREDTREQNYSYELRCFFIRPGKDWVIVRPNIAILGAPKKVEGRPRVFAVWVKSSLKRHKLYALFSDYKKKISSVYMGDLAFDGWLRLEQIIPSHLIKRNPYNRNRYEITFEALKIQSDASEPAGLFIIAFDLLMLAVDHHKKDHPGAQMDDDIH